jgi:hypothetical protein
MFFKNGWKRYLFRQTGSSILPEEAQWQKMKADAAFRKNPPSLQVEAFKILREILIAQRQSIQSRGFIDPDAMIKGLETR